MLIYKWKFLFFGLLVLTLNSCSLGFLASKEQNIKLVEVDSSTITLDKNNIIPNKNAIRVARDNTPHQLILEKNGFKKDYRVCYPQKINPFGYATMAWNIGLGIGSSVIVGGIPRLYDFAIAYQFLLNISGFGGAAIFGLSNPKFLDYNKTINFDNLVRIPQKDSLSMNIKLDKVQFDVKPENILLKSIYYHNYTNKSMKSINKRPIMQNGYLHESEAMQSDINKELAKIGFNDTSRTLLNSSYNKNRSVNATVIGYTFNYMKPFLSPIYNSNKDGFVTIEMKIKFELFDYYKNLLLCDTIHSVSGEFVSFVSGANSHYEYDSEKDALHIGLYRFMSTNKFSALSHNLKKDDVTSLDSIYLTPSTSFVNNIEQAIKSTVSIKSKTNFGSGFVVSTDGYILTNYHVVSDTVNLKVVLNDGKSYPAKIIRVSKDGDVALIKIQSSDLVPFKIVNKKNFKLGKDIFVIGTPKADDLSQSLSKGIISGVRNSQSGSVLIQTDASVSTGYSGGPMIDKEGNLIAIVSAKVIGSGVEGIAFGIPSMEITKNLFIGIR